MGSEEETFKQTELSALPDKWTVSKVGDLVEHRKGFAFKSDWFLTSGRPVIKVSDFTDDSLESSDYLFLDEEKAKSFKDFEIRSDDIIIATVGSWPNNPASIVGKVVKASKEAEHYLLNQNAVILRAKDSERVYQSFLFYRLRNKDFSEYAVSGAQGSANQASITLDSIFSFEFWLPSLDEQKSLAKILSDLDSKIIVNRKMNKILEEIGQAVFERWFVDFEFPNEEGKPYKSSGGEMVYNSALDKEIPAKWLAKQIGELAKINEHSINRDFNHSEIEYIDIDSVDKGIIRNHQILQLADAPSRAKRIVKNQDIIISTVRPNLKHFAFIQNAKPNTIASTGFAVISPMKGNSKFLYYHLTSDKYTNYLSAIADSHTSTYPSFNPDIIEKSVVAFPGENEQQVIANLPSQFDLIMEGLFCKIENNSEQISTLSQLRDLLLPKLMSGKIRVPIQKENVEA